MKRAIEIEPKLGSRALTSFAVWATAVFWTFCYSEGAGFGAVSYVCAERESFSGHCTLMYQPLFPPAVSVWNFIGNLASLWFSGLYDTGLMAGFFLTIGLLAIATQMRREAVERVFSWLTAIAGGAALATIGYFYEVHQTLATGYPHVPHF